MNNFIEKLAMNGYGGYIWTSFGIVLVALTLLYLLARWRLKKALKVQKKLNNNKP
ncbi:MAG: heme exporter protein CcmD [Gammaproteobacteria bacterium]|nr:MAG: heme exporter protein CcmD [Gammaproteobacteria bacterium]